MTQDRRITDKLPGRPLQWDDNAGAARAASPSAAPAAGQAGLAKLREVAQAATPGPWEWWTSNSTLRLTGADGKDGGVLYAYGRSGNSDICCSPENQAFIATFNPATVLGLLDRLAAPVAADTEQATIDTPEFSQLLARFCVANEQLEEAMGREVFEAVDNLSAARAALIAHIDSVKLTTPATPADAGAGQQPEEQIEFPHSYRKWDLKPEDYVAPPEGGK